MTLPLTCGNFWKIRCFKASHFHKGCREYRHVRPKEGFHHQKCILVTDSTSQLLWWRQGDRHNKSACAQRQQFLTDSADSACNRWHICVTGAVKELGGRWLVFSKQGKTRSQWLHHPPACCVYPRSHAKSSCVQTLDRRTSLMTDKNVCTLKALQVTRPGTMFPLQTLHAHGAIWLFFFFPAERFLSSGTSTPRIMYVTLQ